MKRYFCAAVALGLVYTAVLTPGHAQKQVDGSSSANDKTIRGRLTLQDLLPIFVPCTGYLFGNATTPVSCASTVPLSSLAPQATNTIVGNATAGSAAPTALAIGSCDTATKAVQYTTNTGFGCNTAINAATLGGATFAAPGPIGSGTPGTGAFTTVSVTGQFTSTLATGTAPFSIASTTLVPNLYVARAALADTVTTSSNLTGDVTSVGNATTYNNVVSGAKGGTGVANTGKTVTIGASLTTTGAGAPTLAFPASPFTYTFPGAAGTLATLAGTEALTNKDLTGAGNTFPTFNQNTTGSAAKWTTARLLAGNSVDGSANVAFPNKFIVQGTTDSGLTGAQFLGALGTCILKNTTTTGVLSCTTAGTDYLTSVGLSFTGGLISVGSSPLTANGTIALTVAGTSGGVPYFSGGSTWASSALLASSAIVLGGGAGNPPVTTTTGTGVVTALGLSVSGSGALCLVTNCVMVAPTLGAATATSVNKVAFTAPASSATVAIADGTTLTETSTTSVGRGQYLATNTNDSATAGNIGEYVSASMTNNVSSPASGVTITINSPAVVTWPTTLPYTITGTGCAAVNFTTTGALPTGIVAGTNYFLDGASISGNTFKIATTCDNAIAATYINTSGSQSGTHTGQSNQLVTSAAFNNVVGIRLGGGSWRVDCDVAYFPAAGVTVNVYQTGLVTTTDSNGTLPLNANQISYPAGSNLGTNNPTDVRAGPSRATLSGNTTYYCTSFVSGSGNFTTVANIQASRPR